MTLGLPPEELGPVFERWAEQYRFDRAIVMTNPPEKEKPSIERYLLGSPGAVAGSRPRQARP